MLPGQPLELILDEDEDAFHLLLLVQKVEARGYLTTREVFLESATDWIRFKYKVPEKKIIEYH